MNSYVRHMRIAENVDDARAVLFMDVKKSSEKWANNPSEMMSAVSEYFYIVNRATLDNYGFVVKTIGDAFMCCFLRMSDAVVAAIQIQNADSPTVAGAVLESRIGICYGHVIEKRLPVQGVMLRDFFGNTVNVASRMESAISPVGGFAFAMQEMPDDAGVVKALLKDAVVTTVNYENMSPQKERRRSARLLTDEHVIYASSDDLRGARIDAAYRVDM